MFSALHAWTFPVSISYPARSPKVRRGLTVMSEYYWDGFFRDEEAEAAEDLARSDLFGEKAWAKYDKTVHLYRQYMERGTQRVAWRWAPRPRQQALSWVDQERWARRPGRLLFRRRGQGQHTRCPTRRPLLSRRHGRGPSTRRRLLPPHVRASPSGGAPRGSPQLSKSGRWKLRAHGTPFAGFGGGGRCDIN